ncbi:hypothetical protein Kpol_1058p43 [Vanderwaltozyma polyspora DSM 70294]|uniref:ATP-dependent rRNA helicase SPB4 n=1 Tax=Vanderwaltozyma polyspora (strain ATCC 22028 / DSM 70294 / BCRC 21397 / CBS 2163 / NBRC 10782 / NRRL Y-8283 / UCD 57-17) TaxID=436907 RepID=SPB4_VANPO|nr:uncharacterized protein Kpol_1058p43 [Vanderwaltozyma polyspora DSM 70294]A7TJS7.1 RecName: Full=ATP-dependent rRNA helicase SPB4 [Vanderwaltozyma polyspora DSM 70294]EDO17506.1 hypothetical protein Kpol_1058p43 [Vanderwaltozyma polyspora DSM 70294]
MSKSLLWDDLEYPIQPWIRSAVDVMGFENMTPVQAATIPLFARNKDVVVDSVTGSGKTVSFVIPIFEKIVQEEANTTKMKKGHFHSLIVSPTKELAKQIHSVFESFLEHYPENLYPIRSQLLVGTNVKTVRDDVSDFMENKPQILIGTPGRILDFLKIPSVKTSMCSMVILDEADRLLDVSFLKDMENIMNILPKQRRTGLFSATITSAGDNIFKTGLRNPVKVTVNSKSQAPSSLKIDCAVVETDKKLEQVISIINNYKFKKCIAYFPTCHSVTYFYSFMQYLLKKGIIKEEIQIYSLHGKLQTSARIKTLETFTETISNAVLLTTDVAARGIDIPDVDLVLQLDPPTDPEVFLHRCGRTGRANKLGKAITFLTPGREEDYIPFMEVKNINLEEISLDIVNLPDNFYEIFKDWLLEDRARLDQAVKSYVAYIKTYSKHAASSIFRLQSFDYVGLAKFYGLIRLPKMPEITKYFKEDKENARTFGEGWLIDPPINMDKFGYLDKKKEDRRLADLKNLKSIHDKKKLKSELKKKNMSWSNNTQSKEEKVERRTKMALKRKRIEEELSKEADENSSGDDEQNRDWKQVILQNKKSKNSNNGMQGSFDDL